MKKSISLCAMTFAIVFISVKSSGQTPDPPVISNSVNGNIYVNYSQMVTPATSYQITASNLTGDLTIVANTQSSTPGNCQLEISLSPDGGYSALLTISPVDGSVSTTIYVKPGCDDVPVYCTGTITHSSSGATNDVIDVYLENEYYFLFAPVVTLGEVQAVAGSVVYVPMTATDYDSVGFAVYYIDFDPDVLSYIGIENAHESLPYYNICNNCSDPNLCCAVGSTDYILSYVTDISPVLCRLYIEVKLEALHFNVPDGEKVFDLVFNYSGGYSDLMFTDGYYYYSTNPGYYDPEIINNPFENYYINGSVGPVINPPLISNSENGYLSVIYSQMVTPATAYQVTGSNLTNDLVIDITTITSSPAGTQLEISLNAEDGYSTQLVIPPVNGAVDRTIYVRPDWMDVPVYTSGVITHSSTGAVSDILSVSIDNEYSYQYAPIVTIGNIQALPGADVQVPVTATNFNGVGVIAYYIDYDPTVLTFNELINVHPNFPPCICNNCPNPYPGYPSICCVTEACGFDAINYVLSHVMVIDPTHYRLFIKVRDETIQFTIPDGEKLFDLDFTYAGGYSDLTFSDGYYYYSGNGCGQPYCEPEIINEPFADYYVNGSVRPVSKTVNLSMNLEGLYSPSLGEMRKARGESGEYFSGTIADQISIKLATGTFPYSIIYEIGSINLDQNGHCEVEVPFDYNDSYYIIVTHRNSIETWTALPVSLSGNGSQYDFTTAINSAYGENMKLISGTYCFYGGDVNQDDIVDIGDMTLVDNESSSFTSGYIPEDVNGDGIVDIGDMVILDNNANNFIKADSPSIAPSPPAVMTMPVINIYQTTALSGGIVNSSGGFPVISRGVCWGLATNPTIADSHTIDGTGTGSYVSAISGLLPETTYHLRAYATNITGTGYGSEISFTTSLFAPGEGVTDIDGNVYTSVILGTQEWLVQNLKTTRFVNGEVIPNITDNTQWGNLSSSAWSWYNNNNQFENPYGKLYNWYAVVDTRHLCPAGWHVPNDQEWTILTDFLGGLSIADEKIKEAGTAHWPNPNSGTNASGLTGLPGGYRNSAASFLYYGQRTYWWSSSEYDSIASWGRSLGYDFISATRGYYYKKSGMSVRCMK